MLSLKDWIQQEFPERTVMYRGKAFRFHTDAPNGYMEEIAELYNLGKMEGMDRVRAMLRILSIDPKITAEDMAIIPEEMLRELWDGLFPKKAATASPPTTTENTSSAL